MITPCLWFLDVALSNNVQRLSEFVVERDCRWAAALTDLVPSKLIRDVVLPATKSAACSSVSNVEFLANAGFETIIMTGRVIDAEALRRLHAVAERTQIVAVIDHFRHAELLSQCRNQSGCEIYVLIEVDLGRQSTGVRPGPDATLLATAASQLPGLKVVGIFAAANYCCETFETKELETKISAAVTLAEYALRSIHVIGSDCREIVVSVATTNRRVLQHALGTCLIVSPFIECIEEPNSDVVQPAVSLFATVISRPALEWCVIDAGKIALGDASNIRVHLPTGARILHSTHETSTLKLGGESCDLRIGDFVQLTPQNPESLLNRGSDRDSQIAAG
ncbi:MAG: alanine racemase [Planctomycetota bacterium]|nr:alanine racemase [Planctomycetota bacterium]